MRLLAALIGSAAVIALAAPAQADTGNSGPNAGFLSALDQAGITYHDRADAVAVGKKACELMDQGINENDVIRNVAESNPGFTMSAAAQFTMIAASSYCPQHAGEPPAPAPPPTQPWSPVPFFPWPTPGAA